MERLALAGGCEVGIHRSGSDDPLGHPAIAPGSDCRSAGFGDWRHAMVAQRLGPMRRIPGRRSTRLPRLRAVGFGTPGRPVGRRSSGLPTVPSSIFSAGEVAQSASR